MAVRIVKPEHKPTLDAAIDAAVAVLRQDESLKKHREAAIAQAKKEFPDADDTYLAKVQDLAIVHTLVGRIVEQASEVSDNLAELMLESISKVCSVAMLQLIFGRQEAATPPAEPKKVASEADIPDFMPINLRKMKES